MEDIWGPERNQRITASQAGILGRVKGNLILRISRSDLRLIAFVSAWSAFAGEVAACRGALSQNSECSYPKAAVSLVCVCF